MNGIDQRLAFAARAGILGAALCCACNSSSTADDADASRGNDASQWDGALGVDTGSDGCDACAALAEADAEASTVEDADSGRDTGDEADPIAALCSAYGWPRAGPNDTCPTGQSVCACGVGQSYCGIGGYPCHCCMPVRSEGGTD
jgi:hypothetical protein